MRFPLLSLPQSCLDLSYWLGWSIPVDEIRVLCKAQTILTEYAHFPDKLVSVCSARSSSDPDEIRVSMDQMVWVMNQLQDVPPANAWYAPVEELNLKKPILEFILDLLAASQNCHSAEDSVSWIEFQDRIKHYFEWEVKKFGSFEAVDQMMLHVRLKDYLNHFFADFDQSAFFTARLSERIPNEPSYPKRKVQGAFQKLKLIDTVEYSGLNVVSRLDPETWIRMDYAYKVMDLKYIWSDEDPSTMCMFEELAMFMELMAEMQVPPPDYKDMRTLIQVHATYPWTLMWSSTAIDDSLILKYELATEQLLPTNMQAIRQFSEEVSQEFVTGPLYPLVYSKVQQLGQKHCSRSPMYFLRREVAGRYHQMPCNLRDFLGHHVLEKVFGVEHPETISNAELLDIILHQSMSATRLRLISKSIAEHESGVVFE